jgi:hypothetical protein
MEYRSDGANVIVSSDPRSIPFIFGFPTTIAVAIVRLRHGAGHRQCAAAAKLSR